MLRFRGRLAERTIDTVRRVLDTDEEFRRRVLATIDPTGDATAGSVADPTAVPSGEGIPDGDDVDRVTELFLRRPPGWEEEWSELLADAEAEDRRRGEHQAELEASRRADAAATRLARQRDELDALRDDLAGLRATVDAERSERVELARRLDEVTADLRTAVGERDRAVGELAASRRSLAELHDELRAVRSGVDPETVAGRERRLESVAALRAALSGVLSELARVEEDLVALSDDLSETAGGEGGSEPVGGPPATSSAAPAPDPTRQARSERRRPIQLRRGVLEGSPSAVDQLLRVPGVVVFVDGYNLGMTVWRSLAPAALRDRTVGFLTDVATRTGAEVVVVFDGGDVGQRLAVAAPLGVRTLYSPTGVEADDVLIDVVADLPVARPVVVVSSDRRVRDGVRRSGANVLRSEELWAWGQESARG